MTNNNNKRSNKQKSSKNNVSGGISKKSTKPRRRGGQNRARSGNSVSTNTYSGGRRPMTSMSNGATVVTHTETYGVAVTGTSGFEVFSTFALQPGLETYSRGSPLGIWLPQIARNYDNYEIQSLRFNYRTACSTLEKGIVSMAFEPNPEGSIPTTYTEYRNMHSVDGSCHANLSFDVSKFVAGERKLIRKGPVVNLPSYDMGKVYIATIGCTDNTPLGFVDVSYTVKLLNPQSAITSIVPSFVYSPSRPVTRFEFVPQSTAASNAATDCFQVAATMVASSTVAGADMWTKFTGIPNYNATVWGGCKFAQTTAVPHWVAGMKSTYGGRYNVKVQIAADFEDLKLFAANMFAYRAGTLGPSSRQIVDAAGSVPSSLTNIPVVHRGFSGTAVGDPNPGTDLGLVGSWEVALDPGDALILGVGVRTYNSVSSANASVTFRTELGPSFIELEYLGPLAQV